jgi:signal transduction histidine kinase
VPVFLRRLQERIELSCARLGLAYPWWIPAYATAATVILAVAAVVQRNALFPPTPVALAGLLALGPTLLWMLSGRLLPPLVESLIITVAVALLLTHPVSPDVAPFLLTVAAGEIAATSRLYVALAVATLGIGVLAVATAVGHLDGAALYIIGVVLGVDVGIALRWQMRALSAERANTAIAQEQAALAERQRLAREVHDVVGHSLSITLLHITGARHSLQEHHDVADAIDSLAEAERVGRAAMGDLRRTVSVLGSGQGSTQPLPGLAELPVLVERSRSAGLDLRFEQSGANEVGATAALGVYRVAQESLANIAKHAPKATASICLVRDEIATRLTVRNTLPAGLPGAPNGGSGLVGMAARAEQIGAAFRAGVDGDCWQVELIVPAAAGA